MTGPSTVRRCLEETEGLLRRQATKRLDFGGGFVDMHSSTGWHRPRSYASRRSCARRLYWSHETLSSIARRVDCRARGRLRAEKTGGFGESRQMDRLGFNDAAASRDRKST